MVIRKYKLSTFGETKRLLGIDENLIEPILFVEKLYVFDDNGKKVGRFSLKIDKEEGETTATKILYVHISIRAYFEGKLSESIVTGTVNSKLKTLEEIRYESSEISDFEKHERVMFLLREKTKYYVSVTNSICDMKNKTHFSIPFVEALGLLSESANAALLRILATKGYEGILSLKTILSNGKRCRNYYVTKLSEQIINRKKMQVLIIYRNITNHKKYNVTMTLALSRAGQLIYLFWSNSKYFLHIDPDAVISTRRFRYAESKLHTHWHKDIQLYSLYLDAVDKRKMLCRSYNYENEPLKRIVGDFVEYVLLLKPSDIVCFAIKYFTAFGRERQRNYSSQASTSSKHTDEMEDHKNLITEEGEEREEKEFTGFGESERLFFGEG